MRRLIIEILSAHGPKIPARGIMDKDHVIIGRGFDADVILDDPYISARHVRLEAVPGGIRLQDLGSENGTLIGEQELNVDTLILKSGQEITLGRTRIRLYLPDHDIPPTRKLSYVSGLRRKLDDWTPAILMFLLSLVLVLYDAFHTYPTADFTKETMPYIMFGYSAFVWVAAGVIAFSQFIIHHKAYFKLVLFLISAIFVVLGVFSFLSSWLYFLISNYRIETFVTAGLLFIAAAILVLFERYLMRDILSWRDGAIAAVLAALLTGTFLYSAFNPNKWEPRYSDSVIATMQPAQTMQTLPEFFNGAKNLFSEIEIDEKD